MTAINVANAMQDVTLNVDLKGLRILRVRVWLGAKLIILAARIMGCGIQFERSA